MPRRPGRPPSPQRLAPEQRKRSVRFSLAPDVDDAIDALAAREGTSRTGLVERLVREAQAQRNGHDPP